MGCSHAEGCPLFPLLRASLRGWRNYYCDSDDRWLDCARYKLSLTGQVVPISLLPNGHEAQHLKNPSAADHPGYRPVHARPEPTAHFEQVPAHRPAPPPPQRAPAAPRRKPARSWWKRLTDWMGGPA